MSQIGIVVIGRNEGQRLNKCLESVTEKSDILVYVDSGSTDGSVDLARSLGADCIELDLSVPFTAARARNTGFNYLLNKNASIDYVQFIDGDCELFNDWLIKASDFLDKDASIGIVCGRLRERFPERSIYNKLCDIEWDTPVGKTKACGGIFMVRSDAFQCINGFRESLIAGEEPELCLRLRQSKWAVWRLDENMALHDAAMTHFRQWWKRMMRGGYAFAEGSHLHGSSDERHWVTESRRVLFWGLLIPLIILSALTISGSIGLLLLLVYPAQILRLALRGNQSHRENWLHASFLVLGKFPEVLGYIKYHMQRIREKQVEIIEYK